MKRGLVVALVILSIFGNSLTPIVGLTEFRNQCTFTASTTCTTTNSLPPTWNIPQSIREGGTSVTKSCSAEFPGVQCVDRTLVGFA